MPRGSKYAFIFAFSITSLFISTKNEKSVLSNDYSTVTNKNPKFPLYRFKDVNVADAYAENLSNHFEAVKVLGLRKQHSLALKEEANLR